MPLRRYGHNGHQLAADLRFLTSARWHTSGGSQCYEATLSSTDTDDTLDNNNFTGPDTVSLAGAKAFE
jgi:hypothetical protein